MKECRGEAGARPPVAAQAVRVSRATRGGGEGEAPSTLARRGAQNYGVLTGSAASARRGVVSGACCCRAGTAGGRVVARHALKEGQVPAHAHPNHPVVQ